MTTENNKTTPAAPLDSCSHPSVPPPLPKANNSQSMGDYFNAKANRIGIGKLTAVIAVTLTITAILIACGIRMSRRSGQTVVFKNAAAEQVFSFQVTDIQVEESKPARVVAKIENLSNRTLIYEYPWLVVEIGNEWGRMFEAVCDVDPTKKSIGNFKILKWSIDIAPKESRTIVYFESQGRDATYAGKPVALLHQIWADAKGKPVMLQAENPSVFFTSDLGYFLPGSKFAYQMK